MNFYKPLLITSLLTLSSVAEANTLNVSNGPLFLTQDVAPRTLLVVGRDHKLYYEAYNNTVDLNGDGALDIRFSPTIAYYGYFDHAKCYNYSGGKFSPAGDASDDLFKCSGNWSGNFLNYVTTSRIDALRKVLYGGYRYIDTSTETVLERSYIPQDSHSWGAEYRSVAVDGYNISDYTPYAPPTGSNYHLFANTTLKDDGAQLPRMRVLVNQPYRVWQWLSKERPVAGSTVVESNNSTNTNVSANITDYTVRVEVCNPSKGLGSNCKLYPNGNYKPTGLLQDYGENNAMYFGILTGSYNKNLQGGVLRSPIGSITNEIDVNTGEFTNVDGVISSLNNLRFTLFGGNYVHDCGGFSWLTTRTINNGECRMWGNPIGEMMYEGLRYFAGKASPTGAFNTSGSTDGSLGLASAVWDDPYASPTPWCAKPNMLVISDVNPSYDSDSVPGSYFNAFTGDLTGFNAANAGATIWNNEMGGSGNHFIGRSQNNYDGAPTPKTINSFGNIRGLSPEEPNKQGSYYSASAAYFGRINDISTALNDQLVYTFVVALSSPLPEINISVAGQTVTLIPFAKSVGGCLGIDGSEGAFQPTNTIVDFYIESLTATSGVFRVNFEDVEQGADHDMDAIARYTYTVSGNNVTIQVDSTYAAGCIIQHMGYVISGTTADGVYLEVRDLDTGAGSDADYFLDTPNTASTALPTTATRTFTVGNSTATHLKSPLWYAAKWGGFNDLNNNNIPDQTSEFDADADGVPDNYFLVTNALNLGSLLAAAFNKILERSGSFSSAALSSGFLSTDTKIYQAIFTTGSWKGQLLAFDIDQNTGEILTNGGGPKGSLWDAGTILNGMNWKTGRQVITYKPSNGTGIKFFIPSDPDNPSDTELDPEQINALKINPQTFTTDNKWKKRIRWLRGHTKNEKANGGPFRDRDSILGDMIDSNPLLVAAPSFQYFPFTDGPESDYNAFKVAQANRTPVVYVGANDGMLHAFNANTGVELLAYIPSKVYDNITQLTNPNYSHRYYVDGSPNAVDVYYGGGWHTILVGGLGAGGQGFYALDVTNPSNFSEGNAANIVKWEFTDLDDNDLGLTYSRPSIVRLANEKWAAVFGNGYNNTASDGNVSSTGNAVLFIVDIETGTLIKKFDTEVGMAEDPLALGRPNGLATPSVIDVNGDSVADYIYVGDLFGNLWKIDVQAANPSQWGFAHKQGNTPVPLFVAKDAANNPQPITGTITASRIGGGLNQYQIYFGTGKYFETGDNLDQSIQSFYAIRDDGSSTVGRNDLLEQTIISEPGDFRITSNNPFIANSHKGWYLDLVVGGLPVGERVISDPIYRQGKIIFTTIVPDSDPCEYGGTSWLMELDALGGSRLPFTPFDINNDGQFNNNDLVDYTDNEGNTQQEVASGMKSTVGLVSTPVILNAGNKEYKYMPGSSGNVHTVGENPGSNVTGRQSWRQIK